MVPVKAEGPLAANSKIVMTSKGRQVENNKLLHEIEAHTTIC